MSGAYNGKNFDLKHADDQEVSYVSAYSGYNHDGYVTITSGDFRKAMYKGNVVANAQAIVSKAAKAGAFDGSNLWTELDTISGETLDWIEAVPGSDESYLAHFLQTNCFLCNLDVMFHANKGTVGLRLDNVQHSKFTNISVKYVKNMGGTGSLVCNYESDEFSHPLS
jgi:hypothetical protein